MIAVDPAAATFGLQLELAVEITGPEACNISATGEIDMATASRLASLLEEQFAAGRRTVQLDLSSVTFCSCACLRVLVDARNRLTAARGALQVTGMSSPVRRLLTLTGLYGAFHPAPA